VELVRLPPPPPHHRLTVDMFLARVEGLTEKLITKLS